MADAPTQSDPSQAARKVELIVAQLDSLPTLPRIATRLLRLTRSDQASTREVIELIKQDQAVTAKILSLARRANWGIRGEATTIDKCVLLMGLEAVRNTVLSIKICQVFDPAADPGLGRLDLASFWKHSLAVAVACEQLALRVGKQKGFAPGLAPPPADELFVAGLLHDIGKAALHHCLPKSYGKVIDAAEASHAPLLAIERRLIGIDHTVVGKRLAQRWRLPAGVIDAIWLHHNPPGALPDSVRQRGFAPWVFLADLLVRELRLGYSGNYHRLTSSSQVAGAMGISREDLDPVAKGLPEELANRASIIGIDQLDSRDLYYEALSAANDELASLNTRLISRGANLSAKTRYLDLLNELARRARPGNQPIEATELIGQLLLPVLGAARLVVFSEPPAERGQPDAPIEGVVVDASPVQAGQVVERFLLRPQAGQTEGLASARRGGWFDPSQSAEQFSLYPLEGHLSWVHQELDKPLPLADCHLLPLPADGGWVGGLVFPAGRESELLQRWPGNRSDLMALATAAGQVLRISQLSASADRLAEELARAAEQCARLREQLVHDRAMASVGVMAAGAGHVLNNPLMVISGRSELLAAEEQDPRRREALDQIRQNAQRASEIITDLMALAHPPPANPDRVDLGQLLGSLTSPLERSGIAVTVNVPADLPATWADPAQLREVIQEILDNAQQAMAAQDANRRLTVIAAEPAVPGGDRDERVTGVRELEIVITDTGIGMEPAVLEHATEPFFSARPAGRGRGLGLARARRLIEHNGGSLRLESAPGVGTTARITVPVAEG